MNVATNAAARKSFFSLPNEVFEDPYFAKEKRVFSRLDALAWIAKHVRWTDNCVLKRGEGQWSLSFMADAWSWHVSKVRRFLKRLEEANIIRTARDRASDIAQVVITYLFSTGYKDKESSADIDPTVDRHSTDTKTNTGNESKKDSPCSPPEGGDQPDYFSQWGSAGAGPEQTERPVADEQDVQPEERTGAGTSSDSAPEQDAGSPPNSAAPPKKPRKPREPRVKLDIDGWQPSSELITSMMEETGASRDVIDWNVRKMRDWCRTTTKPVKDLNARFRNWMRSWKEDQDERAKRQNQFKTAKEKEFAI